VHDAIKNGWATSVHQEPLTELAATAEDRYDVISMHHYLEHTVDPEAEIAAAARLLTPGGLLIVEVPNPDSRPGRFLKSLWPHWTPSQHLQLLPASAMTELVERHGFGIDRVEYGRAHQSPEFTVVVGFLVGQLVPEQIAPWNTATGSWRSLTFWLLHVVALPLFIVVVVVDGLWARAIRRSRRLTNTYAVIARRDGGSASPG
jgi:SAM-dependent methyltransferase